MKVALLTAFDIYTCQNIVICEQDFSIITAINNILHNSDNPVIIIDSSAYYSYSYFKICDKLNISTILVGKDITDWDCHSANTLQDAIIKAYDLKFDSAFIIGSPSIYDEALSIKYDKNAEYQCELDTIYTIELDSRKTKDLCLYNEMWYKVDYTYADDNFMSRVYTNKMKNYNDILAVYVYRREYQENTTDKQYIEMLKDILDNGQVKHTRAGDTLSEFGKMLRFNLLNSLPILTSKKVFSKGCIYELLWFLKGDTNIKYLVDNNVHIWDDDAYRYFLQNIHPYIVGNVNLSMPKDEFLTYVKNGDRVAYVHPQTKEICNYYYGELGPVYGKQWTDWNGINQITNLINTLKTNPDDRRLMVSAWNVGQLSKMALPPCHYMSQWYTTTIPMEQRQQLTDNKKLYTETEMDSMNIPKHYLSCMWHQRSVDTCLGFPYDLLSYSILTYMIASVCNMVPYEVLCTLGDTHIYTNQLGDVYKQIDRNYNKYKSPKLSLDIKDNIYDYTYNDIHIEEYKSYSNIKYKLSVGL